MGRTPELGGLAASASEWAAGERFGEMRGTSASEWAEGERFG
jgi:hypothetical protein